MKTVESSFAPFRRAGEKQVMLFATWSERPRQLDLFDAKPTLEKMAR